MIAARPLSHSTVGISERTLGSATRTETALTFVHVLHGHARTLG